MAENDNKQDNPYDVELPQSIVDEISKFLLPEIRAFYSSPEGQKAFREWQGQQNKTIHKAKQQSRL